MELDRAIATATDQDLSIRRIGERIDATLMLRDGRQLLSAVRVPQFDQSIFGAGGQHAAIARRRRHRPCPGGRAASACLAVLAAGGNTTRIHERGPVGSPADTHRARRAPRPSRSVPADRRPAACGWYRRIGPHLRWPPRRHAEPRPSREQIANARRRPTTTQPAPAKRPRSRPRGWPMPGGGRIHLPSRWAGVSGRATVGSPCKNRRKSLANSAAVG